MALPEAYKNFLSVFNYKETYKLLPYCLGVDYIIYMQPGTQPPAELLYGMSRDKLQVFKKYLEDNLSKEFIWTLSLRIAAPVLFVKKPKGSLWLYKLPWP